VTRSLRRLRHLVEGALAWLAFALVARLPRPRAAALAAAVARALGPRLPVSRTARRNLAAAMPELAARDIERVVAGMWDNLGRLAAEYPHLAAIDCLVADGPVELVGREVVEELRTRGGPVLFVSAHFGNWEILPLMAGQLGMPVHYVYRPANNPVVEGLVQRFRGATLGAYHPKGAAAARGLVAAIKRGEHVAMLADQKLNDGVAIPFFGRPAMTAPAPAELALRFALPIVPVKVERAPGARFRVTVHPPLAAPEGGDRAVAVAAVLGRINAAFEAWIRARPDHWLWLHRRWPQ
jgi:KDO2-lipid IV(A) lauroyltransferase